MVKYNFHTHTYRCGHASGEDEDYVIDAINNGYQILGFSDHVFYPGRPQPGIRQTEEDYENYRDSVYQLKEKYKDKIKIYLGYEAEYSEGFEEFYKDLVKTGKVDYLICGNHCYFKPGDPNYHWYSSRQNDKELAGYYVSRIIAAIKSGIFLYIAHPDYFLDAYQLEDDFAISQIRQICQCSLDYDVPLEVNVEGMRYKTNNGSLTDEKDFKRRYPYDLFWKIAGEMHVKTVIGIDAHFITAFTRSLKQYIDPFIEKYNLNLLTELDLPNKK